MRYLLISLSFFSLSIAESTLCSSVHELVTDQISCEQIEKTVNAVDNFIGSEAKKDIPELLISLSKILTTEQKQLFKNLLEKFAQENHWKLDDVQSKIGKAAHGAVDMFMEKIATLKQQLPKDSSISVGALALSKENVQEFIYSLMSHFSQYEWNLGVEMAKKLFKMDGYTVEYTVKDEL